MKYIRRVFHESKYAVWQTQLFVSRPLFFRKQYCWKRKSLALLQRTRALMRSSQVFTFYFENFMKHVNTLWTE